MASLAPFAGPPEAGSLHAKDRQEPRGGEAVLQLLADLLHGARAACLAVLPAPLHHPLHVFKQEQEEGILLIGRRALRLLLDDIQHLQEDTGTRIVKGLPGANGAPRRAWRASNEDMGPGKRPASGFQDVALQWAHVMPLAGAMELPEPGAQGGVNIPHARLVWDAHALQSMAWGINPSTKQ